MHARGMAAPWAAHGRSGRWLEAMAGAAMRGPHRGGHRGPWGWGGGAGQGLFAPPFFGPPRAKRGDVRAAALALLAEEPRNGYQIIEEIARRSDGMWRPSSGSVYPALQQLEDEELIRAEQSEGRRLFHLTDAGRAYVAEHEEELAAPWESVTGGMTEMIELRDLMGAVGMAFAQVARAGSREQLEEARKVLTDARRKLYRILAEGDDDAGGDPGERGGRAGGGR
jgi:DNA-binding PadR family transcriptional regulator